MSDVLPYIDAIAIRPTTPYMEFYKILCAQLAKAKVAVGGRYREQMADLKGDETLGRFAGQLFLMKRGKDAPCDDPYLHLGRNARGSCVVRGEPDVDMRMKPVSIGGSRPSIVTGKDREILEGHVKRGLCTAADDTAFWVRRRGGRGGPSGGGGGGGGGVRGWSVERLMRELPTTFSMDDMPAAPTDVPTVTPRRRKIAIRTPAP